MAHSTTEPPAPLQTDTIETCLLVTTILSRSTKAVRIMGPITEADTGALAQVKSSVAGGYPLCSRYNCNLLTLLVLGHSGVYKIIKESTEKSEIESQD